MSESHYGEHPGDFSEAEPIVVTDDMLWAGYQADDGIELTRDDFTALCPGRREDMTKVYRAMAAVEPLVPNLHARLAAERDAALARAEAAESIIAKRYGDQATGVLHPIGNPPVPGCHCKNCDNRWVDVTDEMIAAGRHVAVYGQGSVAAVYRAMVAADDTQPQTDVDKVIDQLQRRIIGAPERTKLRGALDRADAPDKSRAGQDAAVGKALRL